MKEFKVDRSRSFAQDFKNLGAYLVKTYQAFGEDRHTARARAIARMRAIDAQIDAIGKIPFQGTLRPELGPCVRNVTKDNAVIYFLVDEPAETVRVLVVRS